MWQLPEGTISIFRQQILVDLQILKSSLDPFVEYLAAFNDESTKLHEWLSLYMYMYDWASNSMIFNTISHHFCQYHITSLPDKPPLVSTVPKLFFVQGCLLLLVNNPAHPSAPRILIYTDLWKNQVTTKGTSRVNNLICDTRWINVFTWLIGETLGESLCTLDPIPWQAKVYTVWTHSWTDKWSVLLAKL